MFQFMLPATEKPLRDPFTGSATQKIIVANCRTCWDGCEGLSDEEIWNAHTWKDSLTTKQQIKFNPRAAIVGVSPQ